MSPVVRLSPSHFVGFCSTSGHEPPDAFIRMADLFPLRSRVFALSRHLSPVRLPCICPVRSRIKKVRWSNLLSIRRFGSRIAHPARTTTDGRQTYSTKSRKESKAAVCGRRYSRGRSPPSILSCFSCCTSDGRQSWSSLDEQSVSRSGGWTKDLTTGPFGYQFVSDTQIEVSLTISTLSV